MQPGYFGHKELKAWKWQRCPLCNRMMRFHAGWDIDGASKVAVAQAICASHGIQFERRKP
jgi:hypothetical protein